MTLATQSPPEDVAITFFISSSARSSHEVPQHNAALLKTAPTTSTAAVAFDFFPKHQLPLLHQDCTTDFNLLTLVDTERAPSATKQQPLHLPAVITAFTAPATATTFTAALLPMQLPLTLHNQHFCNHHCSSPPTTINKHYNS